MGGSAPQVVRSSSKWLQYNVLKLLGSRKGSVVLLLCALVGCVSTLWLGRQMLLDVTASRGGWCVASSDNLAGRPFTKKLCAPPIDVVYTWVNGSDPLWLAEMERYKRMLGVDGAGDEYAGDGSSASSSANTTDDGSQGSGSGEEEGNGDAQASANRYRDNNELLFSMRSLEKYAPWIRKIHLVTNGQVPRWLNLEHPRINLVTHEDIFANKSLLPVFSSPSIETQLHHINDLSDKFIYFNDDVFLGSDVWPDDFLTNSGQKVYLSWDVPKCKPGCMETWIGDGFCDAACNYEECGWDGPDCVNQTETTTSSSATYNHGAHLTASTYCATGCPNSWIGDRTCDKRCNNFDCGYDGTDCGVDVLHKEIPTAIVKGWEQQVTFDWNVTSVHLDFTAIFGEVGAEEGPESLVVKDVWLDTFEGLRTAVYSKHFHSAVVLIDPKLFPTVPTKVYAELCGNTTHRAAVSPDDFCFPGFEVEVINFFFKLEKNGTELGERNVTMRIVRSSETPPDEEGLSVGNATKSRTDVDGGAGGTAEQLSDVEDATAQEAPRLNRTGRRLLWLDDASSDVEPAARRHNVRMVGSEDLISRNGKWAPTTEERFHDRSRADVAQLDSKRKARFLRERPDIAHDFSAAWRGALSAAAQTDSPDSHVTESGIVHSSQAPVAQQQLPRIRGGRRRLLDTYGQSLIHTNRLISSAFARTARKAPAHMPHFIDRNFIDSFAHRFPKEWAATAAHRFRDPTDIQYAFGYFYWIMEGGAHAGLNMATYWERELDTDGDGVLSKNEFRTLAAVAYGHSPTQQEVDDLFNCVAPQERREGTRVGSDGIIEVTELVTPHVTLDRVMACNLATDGLSEHARFEKTHTMEELDEVAFEMITDDYNRTLDQLDSIRSRKSKFVCVNDDMTVAPPELQQMLQDFYLSFFPHPSQFELPAGTENPYLHIGPMRQYLLRQRVLRVAVVAAALTLLFWWGKTSSSSATSTKPKSPSRKKRKNKKAKSATQ